VMDAGSGPLKGPAAPRGVFMLVRLLPGRRVRSFRGRNNFALILFFRANNFAEAAGPFKTPQHASP